MIEAGGDADLVEEALGADYRGEVGAKNLDGHLPPVPFILGQIDGSHPSPSQLLTETVSIRKCYVEPIDVHESSTPRPSCHRVRARRVASSS